ncbi:ACT domain-containing protein ACR6-like isoform X3 [Salvia hispanica]|uniref:ACT domain-containing protein ACR6-like isoform X3 n=1 Tax=Salvia hispanica TaxID=49212 RepID=UPI00200915A7|nr:ACT domain-containing protein ACR6-like isoform X3 [Salvia hispanica]
MDDEFAKLIRRINPPRVVIDNESCADATIIKVDSVKKHGTLLHVVQILTDMNLVIVKGYISSDAGWFMDVFNVVDCNRKKIMDQEVISDIQTKLESDDDSAPTVTGMVGMVPYEEYTCIELTGADRTGLLSEERLCNVLRSNYDTNTAKLTVSPPGVAHRERRLHQMLADQDFEKSEGSKARVVQDKSSSPLVTVSDRTEKGYTVITVRSDDRPKLLFDTICTLTDMQYVVFHGVVRGGTDEAYQVTGVVFSCYPKLQEYYVRCVDGVPVQSEAERERIAQRLETAIERRSSEGLELELCAEDRIGLLPNITRILRENNLYIKRAEISSKGGKARHIFCVTDVTGDEVDPTIVDSIRQQIGQDVLHVKWNTNCSDKQQQGSNIALILGNLFRNRSFSSFLIG